MWGSESGVPGWTWETLILTQGERGEGTKESEKKQRGTGVQGVESKWEKTSVDYF